MLTPRHARAALSARCRCKGASRPWARAPRTARGAPRAVSDQLLEGAVVARALCRSRTAVSFADHKSGARQRATCARTFGLAKGLRRFLTIVKLQPSPWYWQALLRSCGKLLLQPLVFHAQPCHLPPQLFIFGFGHRHAHSLLHASRAAGKLKSPQALLHVLLVLGHVDND